MVGLIDQTNLKCEFEALAVKLQGSRLKKKMYILKKQYLLNCFMLFLTVAKKKRDHIVGL